MRNDQKKSQINEEENDMGKSVAKENYKKLKLSSETIEKISVTPKVKDGKLLFNRKNKNHRNIVDEA